MKSKAKDGSDQYGIHEVYYKRNGRFVDYWTEEPIYGPLETIKDLKTDLEVMLYAFEKRLLDYDNGKEIDGNQFAVKH